jgi:phage-related tail fiber protein
MNRTKITSSQLRTGAAGTDAIEDGSVSRVDMNTTVVGESVITKLIAGTNITISSTGADTGTGDVTVSVNNIPAATDYIQNNTVISTTSKLNVIDSDNIDFIVSHDTVLNRTDLTADLKNTLVVPGTYRSVSVDSKGRITAGTNPTTLADYGISDAVTASDTTGTGSLVYSTSPVISTSLSTDSNSFNLLNTTVDTINFGGSASIINIGSSNSITTIKDDLVVEGNNLSLGGTSTQISGSTTINSVLPTIITSISGSTYRSAKLFAQISQGTNYTSTELSILHNGTNIYVSEINQIVIGNNIGTLNPELNSGNINFKFTALNSNPVSIKYIIFTITSQ